MDKAESMHAWRLGARRPVVRGLDSRRRRKGSVFTEDATVEKDLEFRNGYCPCHAWCEVSDLDVPRFVVLDEADELLEHKGFGGDIRHELCMSPSLRWVS